MKKIYQDVSDFHRACGVPVCQIPAFPSETRMGLRKSLIRDEYREFLLALEARDLAECADALVDMIYVITGTMIEFGIPPEAWDEVHRSNMAKVDPSTGRAVMRPDGKVLKPEGWQPPDIPGVLQRAHDLFAPQHRPNDEASWAELWGIRFGGVIPHLPNMCMSVHMFVTGSADFMDFVKKPRSSRRAGWQDCRDVINDDMAFIRDYLSFRSSKWSDGKHSEFDDSVKGMVLSTIGEISEYIQRQSKSA